MRSLNTYSVNYSADDREKMVQKVLWKHGHRKKFEFEN